MRQLSSQHLTGDDGGHVVERPQSPLLTVVEAAHTVSVVLSTGMQSSRDSAHDASLQRTGRLRGQVTSCGQSARLAAHVCPWWLCGQRTSTLPVASTQSLVEPYDHVTVVVLL